MDLGRVEKVRCMQRVTRKVISPYVKEIANRNMLCGSGNSNQARGMGWEGRWEGGSKGRGYMIPMADSC